MFRANCPDGLRRFLYFLKNETDMKTKAIVFLLCAFPTLLCVACSDDDEKTTVVDVELSISPETVNFAYEAATSAVTITSNREWAAAVSDDWISVSPTYSVNTTQTMTISVEANSLSTARQGTITIMCGTVRRDITVVQTGDPTADQIKCFLPDYELVWNDEFDSGTTLGSDWTHEVQSAGWVNSELQTYVNGSAGGKRVSELVDGQLNIHCFKGSDGKIYSARVYAKKSVGWTYGYFEARIQLPKGKGTWPAWWMMPVTFDDITNPWPSCGEIDIMEEVGVDANYVVSTIHCKKYNNGGTAVESASRYVETAESDFHNYGLEWTPDYMNFYCDEELLLSYANDGSGRDAWPFDYAFYPILNLAWGGSWGGYAGVDESALPVTMKVEYVRIFQKP